ncbi:putative ribonuclease H-like domain-containing protein [Tanacetum coccineum]
MPPKAMSQAAIERLITQRVNAAVEAERARQVNARGQGGNANEAGGQGGAPAVRECTFSGFMKCNPTVFHGHEGAVELSRWFEKTEMVFGISECAEARKVKFAAATLQGRALTWWNSQVATRGLEAANQIGWTEMKRLMTEEFCPIEEIQRMEHELWNLKVRLRCLQVLQKKDDIFLSQDKYVVDILKKFGYTDIRSANTPMDRENPWGKDGTGKDVENSILNYFLESLTFEANTNFHHIVDFLEASHLRYALTVRPTVNVSHIQQFWSTARVETVDGETKIIAKVNGRQRTVTESSIRRHLKLFDDEAPTIHPGQMSLHLNKDERHRDAFPTATSLDAGQDRENIAKTSAMPHEASPGKRRSEDFLRMELQTHGGMDQGENFDVWRVEKIKANFPTAAPAGVATASGSFPTAVIFTTASVTTPYTRRTRASRGIIIEPSYTTSVSTISAKGKGKEKMVEFTGTKKKKIQEQLDAQVAKELEMEFAREELLIKEQGAMHDFNPKYMTQYNSEADLSLDEKMELITKLIKYQRNLAEIKKYQAQQSKPSTKTEKRNLYMAILKSHAAWEEEDLDRLWSLVKKTFSTTDPIEDKEKELWVELKRLYEPDPRDQLWALQRYMHDP